MGVDAVCLESLLLGSSTSPSRVEKGARGTRQGCGQRTSTRALGLGKLTVHLRAHERAVPVDLSPTLGGPETSYGR